MTYMRNSEFYSQLSSFRSANHPINVSCAAAIDVKVSPAFAIVLSFPSTEIQFKPTMQNTIDPVEAAKAIFIKVLKRYNVDKQMSEDDLEALGPDNYGYIITNNFAYEAWCDEIGVYTGIECEPPFIRFKFAILPSRLQMACLFTSHMYRQLLTTAEHMEVFRQFQGDEGVSIVHKNC
jgi:hypothetical protein